MSVYSSDLEYIKQTRYKKIISKLKEHWWVDFVSLWTKLGCFPLLLVFVLSTNELSVFWVQLNNYCTDMKVVWVLSCNSWQLRYFPKYRSIYLKRSLDARLLVPTQKRIQPKHNTIIPALQTSMISKPMFSPSLSQSVQMTKAWHCLTSFSSVR